MDVEAREEALRGALKSQYHAALAMLRESIERCPAEVWENDDGKTEWGSCHSFKRKYGHRLQKAKGKATKR